MPRFPEQSSHRFTQFGRREVPPSSNFRKEDHAMNVASESSERFIEKVVPNNDAAAFLRPEFRYLLTEEYLVSTSRVLVPPTFFPDQVELRRTSGYGGRAYPVAYHMMPVNESYFVWDEFDKGVGPSAKVLSGNETGISSTRPIGFFGDRDAQDDMQWSNDLIRHGFRASLDLGYVVFNATELADYLVACWKPFDSKQASEVAQAINLVIKNGDRLAALRRVGGVSERFENLKYIGPKGSARRRSELSQVSRLWLHDSVYFPEKFKTYLSEHVSQKNTRKALNKIISHEELSLFDLQIFIDVYTGMIASNVRALQSLQKVNNRLSEVANHECFCAAKDVDLAMITYDFEDIKEVADADKPRFFAHDYIASSTSNLSAFIFNEGPRLFGQAGRQLIAYQNAADIRTRFYHSVMNKLKR